MNSMLDNQTMSSLASYGQAKATMTVIGVGILCLIFIILGITSLFSTPAGERDSEQFKQNRKSNIMGGLFFIGVSILVFFFTYRHYKLTQTSKEYAASQAFDEIGRKTGLVKRNLSGEPVINLNNLEALTNFGLLGLN